MSDSQAPATAAPTEVYLSVNTRLVHQMKPGNPLTAITMQPGRDGEGAVCYAAAIHGRARLLYNRNERLPNGASLYLVTDAGVTVEPLTPGEARERMEALEAEGGCTYVNVNVHSAREDAKTGSMSPIIAIRNRRSGKVAQYVMAVEIDGPCLILGCPERKLACGAKVYIVAGGTVRVTPLDIGPNGTTVEQIIEKMIDDMEDDTATGSVQEVLL